MVLDWAVCHAPRPAARIRLVCFPYAGGNANIFRRWPQLLPDTIEVYAAHLPGRIPRLMEPPLASIGAVVAAFVPKIAALPVDKPLVFFGHSMGAVVAFETARALAGRDRPVAQLAVSARAAPHLPQRRRPIHGLADAEFLDELRKMGGTPDEVLRDAQLMALLLPGLRGDFTAIESYKPVSGPPLACDFSIFGGKSDPDVRIEDLLAWQDHTSGLALVEMHAGGHFFIDTGPERLLATLARDIAHL